MIKKSKIYIRGENLAALLIIAGNMKTMKISHSPFLKSRMVHCLELFQTHAPIKVDKSALCSIESTNLVIIFQVFNVLLICVTLIHPSIT